MSTPLAPWSIFRTSAIAAEGLPWIENGFHLRTKISPLIGFPLHPFAAWRLQVSDEWTEVDIIWSDADKRSHLMPFNIEDTAAGTMGSIVGASAEDPWVWIEVVLEDRGARIDLLGGSVASGHSSPILATRTRDPFRFGGAQISRLLVSGHGAVQAVRGIRLSDIDIWDLHRSPDLTFGLPLEQGPWYAPDPATDPRIAAEQRVRMAAPRRLSPPDNPTGQGPDDTDPDAETARIMEVIGPSLVDPWLVKAFGDPQVAPVDAVFSEQSVTAVGAPLSTNAAVVPSLLTMDVDPQIARYIGLSTMIAFDRTAPEQAANVWLVASRWAVQRDRILRRFLGVPALKLDAYLQSTANTPAWLDTALATAFPGATAIIDNLPNVPDRAGDGPWSAVTLLTLAVAAGKAPPDPPDSFRLSAAEPGAWNAQDPDNRGPESWQQQISLGRHPARGMVGFARISPGAPETLHRREPPPEQGYVSRALPLVPNWAGSNRRLLADVEIPPDPGGARWLVWHADEFGQWSEAAELSMPLPPRPKPPPPVAEVTFSPHPADRSAGARVPGKLHLRLEVPRNIHLPPGSLPIAGLEVTVDGVILPLLDVVPGEAAVLDAEPKAFDIGEYRDVPIAARFIDEEGTRSAETMINAQAYDARAPQAIPSSPMIIWTGQTDATGQAQLSLGWPPQAGADRYRVYMGDARRLAGDLGITLPDTLVRARHSRPIYNLAQNISSKDAFTLVGEAGGKAGDDGRIHFETQIPGALRNVQFVRIVPLSTGGAEADFNSCGLVPVAVPDRDRPPPPSLDAALDPATGLELTLRGVGLRQDVLASRRGGVPQYRLRRTRGGIADRAYARVWHTADFTGVAGDGAWYAALNIPIAKLEPFVRTTWLAEMRYPPEAPLPQGDLALPVDGGVEPLWSYLGAHAESLWSDISLPAESLLIPTQAPRPVPHARIHILLDGSLKLSFSGLPTTHPAAIAPYKLEIYRCAPGEISRIAATEVISADELEWVDLGGAFGDHYDVVVVDPVGRRSEPVRV